MRMVRIAIGLAGWLVLANAVQAGVYQAEGNLRADPRWSFDQFRQVLSGQRAVAVERPEPESPNSVYRARLAELQLRERDGAMTLEDRIDLSAHFLLLMKPEEAVQTLEAVRDRPNFLVLANLATAHFMAGRPERALQYQRQALASWPALWPGFRGDELDWFRRVERYQLALIQSRLQETLRQPGRPPETLDPLFPKFRFTGSEGRYEPGMLAQDQKDELPPDAISIIGQMALWMPHDNRLYWLLGELLNARGQAYAALEVLDELAYARNFRPRELAEHRRALLEVKQIAKMLTDERGPVVKEKLLQALVPRVGLLAPGAGALCQEAAWAGAMHHLTRADSTLAPQGTATSGSGTEAAAAPPSDTQLSWRQIGVGFVAGLVVAWLASLQIREIRRKHGAASHRS